MNKLDILAGGILAIMFIAIFGAFFDVFTPKEAAEILVVLAVLISPLMLLRKN